MKDNYFEKFPAEIFFVVQTSMWFFWVFPKKKNFSESFFRVMQITLVIYLHVSYLPLFCGLFFHIMIFSVTLSLPVFVYHLNIQQQ